MNPKRVAVVEACVIGLVAAIASLILKDWVGTVGGWRVSLANDYPPWVVLPSIGLGGGLLAGWIVQNIAPETAGSGIPQVKAALAQLPIALNWRVGLWKLLTTVFTLGSGFALGRQGPTVQICAALAAQLSEWVPTSPEYRRQLMSAGAAAGLAAGFNAPLAGVMFVIEELLHDLSGITLTTTILASFIGGVVSRILGGQGLTLGTTIADQSQVSLPEIPFFLILGLLCGSLGAVFMGAVVRGVDWSRRFLPIGIMGRIGLAGLVSGLIISQLAPEFRDSAGLQGLLSLGNTEWQFALSVFVIRFGLSVLACSAETPGGLFIPSLILGAALGAEVGILEHLLQGVGSSATYALAGMGAFFGAVTKTPVTAIVIVFEITRDFNLVLPLMIAVITAYLVAEKLVAGSVYANLLALRGINVTEVKNDALWTELTASAVMQTKVETLTTDLTLEQAKQTFARSHHRGFPVLEDGVLVGIITQTDLARAAELDYSPDTPIAQIMTRSPITVRPDDSLAHVLYLLSHYKLSRLPVLDHRRLVGIITRSDILRAEVAQLQSPKDYRADPSYLVYQKQAPATGRGKILLPLSNPQTASHLIKLGVSIARSYQYELECLQIIVVPKGLPTAEARVETKESEALLNLANMVDTDISIHSQIRVAHAVAPTILEIVEAHHIDLLLMGWKGSRAVPNFIFNDVADTAIRQADCDVVLVKFPEVYDHDRPIRRWLLPLTEGINPNYAPKVLNALLSAELTSDIASKDDDRDPVVITLAQIVIDHSTADAPETLIMQISANLQRLLSQIDRWAEVTATARGRVATISVCAESLTQGIMDLCASGLYDAVLLSAKREEILQPEIRSIARHTQCPLFLVRSAHV